MSTTLKTMSLALLGPVLLAGTVMSAAVPAASAATVASMQEAYEASEAARDTMAAQPRHGRADVQRPVVVGSAASAVDGRAFKACRGTHLDHLKGRC